MMTARPWSASRRTSVEHLPGLRDAERRRRLVEDDELGIPHHRLGHRDRLALAARERGDRLADRAQRGHAAAGSVLAAARSMSSSSSRPLLQPLAPEEHVLDDVEIVAQREVLVDDLDAEAGRIARAADADRLALPDDLAGIRFVDAGDAS